MKEWLLDNKRTVPASVVVVGLLFMTAGYLTVTAVFIVGAVVYLTGCVMMPVLELYEFIVENNIVHRYD